MNVLDLFSGIGGFSLGLERAGMRIVAFCEIDEYCRAVLKKNWPSVPCFKDIKHVGPAEVERLGAIDVVCGGFPCQPFSVAGKRKGKDDDRHLWPRMCKIIAYARPSWVIGENVTGLIGMELDNVLTDLEGLGYTTRTFVIPACAVGAPHRRDRIWIVASNPAPLQWGEIKRYEQDGDVRSAEDVAEPESDGREPRRTRNAEKIETGRQSDRSGERGYLADTNSEPQKRTSVSWRERDHWRIEPDVGRVAHGVPRRVDRLRCLGNAVVPQIPEIIGRAIMRTTHASRDVAP